MDFRNLGTSGLKVSAVSYGNRVTHGPQLEADQGQRPGAEAASDVTRPVTQRATSRPPMGGAR